MVSRRMRTIDVIFVLNGLAGSIFVYLDTSLVLSWDIYKSASLQLAFLITYVVSVYASEWLIGTRFVANRTGNRLSPILDRFVKSASIGYCAAVPTWVLLTFFTYDPSLAVWTRYGLYLLFLAGILFVSTSTVFVEFGFRDRLDAKNTRVKHDIMLECWKIALWAFVFSIAGTAYAQVLSTKAVSGADIVVISYGMLYMILFVLCPQTYVVSKASLKVN